MGHWENQKLHGETKVVGNLLQLEKGKKCTTGLEFTQWEAGFGLDRGPER